MKFSFNTIVAPTYKGRDYNYYIQPLKEYGAAYKEVEKEYADLIAQTEAWKVKANQEENPIAYDMYNRYSAMLSEASANFSRGMTQTNRRALLGLKKNYAQEIVPIAEAAKALDVANAEMTKNGPDAIYHKSSPLKIDDFLHGAKPNTKYSSAKGITAKVTAGMTSLKAAYKGDPTLTKGARGKDLEKSGFSGLTPEDRQLLDNITPDNYENNPWLDVQSTNDKNLPNINLRRAAAKFKVDTLKAEGWDDMDDEAKKKALNAANQGLLAVMETPDSKYVASSAATEALNSLKFQEENHDYQMYLKSPESKTETYEEWKAKRKGSSSSSSGSAVKDNAFIMGEIQKALNGDTSSTAVLTTETYEGSPVFALKTTNSGTAKKYTISKDENGNPVLLDVSNMQQTAAVKNPSEPKKYDLASVTTDDAYKEKTINQSYAFNISYDGNAKTGQTSFYPVKSTTLTQANNNGGYYSEGTKKAGETPVAIAIPITYYQGMDKAKVKLKDAQNAIYNQLCETRNKKCANEWLNDANQQKILQDIIASVNGKIARTDVGGRVITSRNIFQLYIEGDGWENDGEDQKILGGMLLAPLNPEEKTMVPQNPIQLPSNWKNLEDQSKQYLINEYQQYVDDEILGEQASQVIKDLTDSMGNSQSGQESQEGKSGQESQEGQEPQESEAETRLKAYVGVEKKRCDNLYKLKSSLDDEALKQANEILQNYSDARTIASSKAFKDGISDADRYAILDDLLKECAKAEKQIRRLKKESEERKKATIEASESAGAISYGNASYADSTAAANKVTELINK